MNHLAIMRNPWMNMTIDGRKTVESRCSIRKIDPYEKVTDGDYIYFRLSGTKLVSYRSMVYKYLYVEGKYAFGILHNNKKQIGIDDEYIKSKSKCRYLSLFWLEPIEKLFNPFEFTQKGQKAWITNLKVPQEAT